MNLQLLLLLTSLIIAHHAMIHIYSATDCTCFYTHLSNPKWMNEWMNNGIRGNVPDAETTREHELSSQHIEFAWPLSQLFAPNTRLNTTIYMLKIKKRGEKMHRRREIKRENKKVRWWRRFRHTPHNVRKSNDNEARRRPCTWGWKYVMGRRKIKKTKNKIWLDVKCDGEEVRARHCVMEDAYTV
jgi:hypothetical protein